MKTRQRWSVLFTVIMSCALAINANAAEEKESSAITALLKAIGVRTTTSTKKETSEQPEGPTEVQEVPESESEEKLPTHQQAAIIKMGDASKLHTFCLDSKGNILAGCGTDQGEIRIFDPDGEPISKFDLPIVPEAINVGPDGHIYVGAKGKLVKLDAEGKVILEKESPHASSAEDDAEKIREQIVTNLKKNEERFQTMRENLERQIEKLETKAEEEELTKSEQRRLKSYKRSVDRYSFEVTDELIEAQVRAMANRKSKMASISITNDNVFIAVPAKVGYGFDIWKLTADFEQGEKIVTGLRGCCGQMDVQANDQGVFVAENAQHRVCCYDDQGELVTKWGSRARTGLTGFGGCCNPMNVNFGPAGDVYTAESTTGRIKRFSPDGQLKDFVGKVELVPGCKKVSIAVSDDGSRVYMLDITRTHIVMMKEIEKAAEVAAVDSDNKQGG